MKKKIAVVGAGVGGLATAIRLQKEGYHVEIYEKESTSGGKMNQIKMDGYTFDLGPTIVMMPQVYKELFEFSSRDSDDYIPMVRLDPMYTVYFKDHPTPPIPVSNDLVQWRETLESISEKDAAGFFSYLNDLNKGFNVAWDAILQKPFRKQSDFYTPSMLKKGLSMKVGGNANLFIEKYIQSEQLKQIISFQTLYIGISPSKSPSFYTMIPVIQFLYGIWFIKGGMYTMATAMEKLFLELGGTIHYNSAVEEILIQNKQAVGIKIAKGKIKSDYVVCNADFPYAMKHLIQSKPAKGKYTDNKIDDMKYSCSCFVMYLGMDRKYEHTKQVHNFVFSNNFDDNMRDIFEGNRLTDASFYVYIASKMDPSLAPKGKDGIYIMMPVSNVRTAKYEWDEETIKMYRTYILQTLKKIKGFEHIEQEIVSEKHFTPSDFESDFNAYNGTAFGLLPSLLQSGHLRPQSKAKNCSNLYFTGSSTHPGAGVPMVLLSAKITAQELILDDECTKDN